MYLGIDCGTQGTKALLLDHDGTARGRGYAPHQLIEHATGAREQQPQWWIDALHTAVQQALAQAPGATIEALGVSGQQHGLVVLDEHHAVIRPAKLWNDTETAPQNAALVARFGGPAAFFHRFGIVPLTGYTVSKLLWLAENEPENFARIRHILLPHEYLNFHLTGRLCSEFGDASGTGYFDPRTRTWIPEILNSIDSAGQLFAALPTLLAANELAGPILPAVAQQLGLSPTCVVSSGGGDNMMGAIGTGNVEPGIVTLSLGTSSTVYSYQPAPNTDSTGSVAPFCSSSGGWLPLVCTMNATNVVTQTAKLLGKTVDDIEAALTSTLPGAGGLTFLPFLNGERTPDLPTARGSLIGLSATNYTPDNLLRAAIEGVSFGILNGLTLVLQGQRAERIRLIGGGARSAQWRQLLADATGAIIEVPTEDEAGCLGAAIQAIYALQAASNNDETIAAIAARYVSLDETKTSVPLPANFPLYQEAMALYRNRLQKLYGVPMATRA